MKNNKGFSLVELIIVIAIMAILVGVMAPQLIKYIEKTNQASDVQLCDSIKTAVTTGYMDPAVAKKGSTIAAGTYTGIDNCVAACTGASSDMKAAVNDILGVSATGSTDTEMCKKLKSKLGKSCDKFLIEMDGATIEVWCDAKNGTITTVAQ